MTPEEKKVLRKEYQKNWYQQNKEHRKEYEKKWGQDNKVRKNKCAVEWRRKIRTMVIERYGARCVHCGESRIEVLDLDHINNNGSFHRSKKEAKGQLCTWIYKNNFPNDFQLLCRNCNWIKYLKTLN